MPGRRPEPSGVRVLQWAQEHGEVGGVRTSVHGLTSALRAGGNDVRYVDTGSARRAVRALPWLWRRRSLHILHITRLWRAAVLAPVFALVPGRAVLLLHSGSTAGQLAGLPRRAQPLLRQSLRAYDEIWAVNDEIRAVLPQSLVGRVRVVSPFVAAPRRDPDPASAAAGSLAEVGRGPALLSVASNAGLPHYNADLAVEAVRLVRQEWTDARLSILAYGADGPALAALRAAVADLPWVSLSFDLPPAQLTEALAASTVFLRPTSWDGDSVIVREALALGTRVVASDVSPRPAGVELAPLDASTFAAAVLGGGPVSRGEGLSTHTVLDAAADALCLVREGSNGHVDGCPAL